MRTFYRRNLIAAASVAVVGILGYLVYEAYNEEVPEEVEEQQSPTNKRVVTLSAWDVILDRYTLQVKPNASNILQTLQQRYSLYLIITAQPSDQSRIMEALRQLALDNQVLWTQTDEGRGHLVRHLLNMPPAGAVMGLAHIDGDPQAAERLSNVVPNVVLVSNQIVGGVECVQDISQSKFFQ